MSSPVTYPKKKKKLSSAVGLLCKVSKVRQTVVLFRKLIESLFYQLSDMGYETHLHRRQDNACHVFVMHWGKSVWAHLCPSILLSCPEDVIMFSQQIASLIMWKVLMG